MSECLMYGVELESRCLANVPAAEDAPTFVCATQNIKMTNQVELFSIVLSKLSNLTVKDQFSSPVYTCRSGWVSNTNSLAKVGYCKTLSIAPYSIHPCNTSVRSQGSLLLTYAQYSKLIRELIV